MVLDVVLCYPPRSTVLFAILNRLSTGLNNTVLLMIHRPFNQQLVNQQQSSCPRI